jgi:hypothetical protein
MVTSESLRQFSSDCSLWAKLIRNPSDRHIILKVARGWQNTAEAIDRYVAEGSGGSVPDLRRKLD